MRKELIIFLVACVPTVLYAQDSTRVLGEVEIQAYRYNRSIADVPVAVAVFRPADIDRFDQSSLVGPVNTTPGVRMEERSPGSYRFSIRGSLIRSPFGVRNVKVYWNSLPLTDGGGNTYLNIVDPSSVGHLEIIKGPGGSLYGANTGGVILMKPRAASPLGLEASALVGSYGLSRFAVRGEFGTSKSNGSVSIARQEADGYRSHTHFRRITANTDWSYAVDPATVLSATVMFSDVTYQTPGGLTAAEYEANPRQARPAAGIFRSAEQQQARVQNQTIFGGLNMAHDWSAKWTSQLGVFSSYNDFENYAIRNYEHRYETNFGGRLENQFSYGTDEVGGKVIFGGEMIYMLSPVSVFENLSGTIGAQQVRDELTSAQYLVFAQSEFFLPLDFKLTIGASSNYINYGFDRTFPVEDHQKKNFSAIVTPRIALLKKIKQHAIYGSISKGFSPPTLAEVRPSTDSFNGDLAPESGVNYETGIKGKVGKIAFDIALYRFNLKETIVLQRVTDGAEYFTNAGETIQKGIETQLTWNVASFLKLWVSYNYNHYRFQDYVKYDTPSRQEIDYSGNEMTGIPPVMATLGVDVSTRGGFYANATNAYTDHIPLNDANTAYASEYMLLSVKTGFRKAVKDKFQVDIYAGVNNILDQTYSLGNDLNAVNGRYYNVAADRNFFLGVKFGVTGKRQSQ